MSLTVYDWQDCTIAIGEATSSEVDLRNNCDFLQAIIPTLDTCTVKVQVSENSGGTFYDLGSSQTTTSGTHNYATTFKLGHYRYVKLVASANQDSAAVTIRVRGMKI